jgi:phosphoglycerate dehydrogenase-like enzyme
MAINSNLCSDIAPVHLFLDVPVDAQALAGLQSRYSVLASIADPVCETEPRNRPPDQVDRAQAIFCTYPPSNLDDMPQLRLIQIASSGFIQLCGLNLPTRGVRACNARGVFDTAIAEWNIAMMVNLARRLPDLFRNQQQGIWDRAAKFQTEIRGATVGLWGYGGIGRQTARLAKALGLQVHVLTRSPIQARSEVYCVKGSGDVDGVLPDSTFTTGQEREFLSGLDFLVLCMPLTPATEGIVGSDELAALPSHAYLLNPARGPLVNEEALIDALATRKIAGAALDTHYYYPMPADHPLWAMQNVIMTPHISGSSESPFFIQRIWELFVENVARWIDGRPLLNELSVAQLEGR